jgi:hypothetical protein
MAALCITLQRIATQCVLLCNQQVVGSSPSIGSFEMKIA